MTINEYQELALRTVNKDATPTPIHLLLNGALGITGEGGEFADIVKKHLFHGHELDKEHLAKELGDIAWYLAISAEALGYKLEDILTMNIDKLKARYPEGFEVERSLHRAEGDI